jgi:hypothetical protein
MVAILRTGVILASMQIQELNLQKLRPQICVAVLMQIFSNHTQELVTDLH